jgi:hypothetical protein
LPFSYGPQLFLFHTQASAYSLNSGAQRKEEA